MSISLRLSEAMVVIAHHAQCAADEAMKHPEGHPGRAFDDHVDRIAAFAEMVQQGSEGMR